MVKSSFIVTFILFIALASADQEVPLRKGQYGFVVGDPKGTLHIEFFLDFLCPDSLDSYNTFVEVMKSVDFVQQGIKLTYQFNPLTWHFYAFKIHQAFFYVLENGGPLQAERFIAYVFAHQNDFAEQLWLDKTLAQFSDYFVNAITSSVKVDKVGLRESLAEGSATWNTARYHWKYTVGMNFVPGAPLFNINSVRVDGADSFTASQWISILKQYKSSMLTREQDQ